MEQHTLDQRLIPGMKICYNCNAKLKKCESSTAVSSSSSLFIPQRPNLDEINSTLEVRNISPINKRLSTPQLASKIQSKVQQLSSEMPCSSNQVICNDNTEKLAKAYLDLLEKLKKTFKSQISYEDKVSGTVYLAIHYP
jgi:hypothetical protein